MRSVRIIWPKLGGLLLFLSPTACVDAVRAHSQRACVVQIEREVQLAPLTYPLTVTRSEWGQYLLVDIAVQDSIQVFDNQGVLVERFGGGGVHELGPIPAIQRWKGDSIAVWDVAHRRLLIYGSLWQAPRVKEPVLPARRAIPRLGDSLLVSADVRTPERVGLALHLLGPSGEIVRSFDGSSSFRASRPDAIARAITEARRSGVWAAEPNSYRIGRWSSAGELLQTISRTPDWFKHNSNTKAQIIDISEDEAGLWVLANVTPISDRDIAYTVVELIDPNNGNLVASSRMEQVLLGWISPRRGYAFEEGQTGGRVTVWKLVLHCTLEEV